MSRVVVLLSGGLDSVTTLAMAQQQGHECYALSFDYGQRHSAELNAARQLAQQYHVHAHQVVPVDLSVLGGSALTDDAIAVPKTLQTGIPVTYVPARNTVFLSIALAWAEVLGAQAIYIGVNAVDYSGYPDCRPAFIEAFEALANVATKQAIAGHKISIEAPLLTLSKADIITAGLALGVDYHETVSCYQADSAGHACGQCDACYYRRLGFAQAGVADQTHYQSAV